jgi:hypothetical protein
MAFLPEIAARHRRGGEHHHRRQRDHDAGATGWPARWRPSPRCARSTWAAMNFALYPYRRRASPSGSTIGKSRSWRTPTTWCSRTRRAISRQVLAEMGDKARRAVRVRVLRPRPSAHAEAFRGSRAGEAAAVHAVRARRARRRRGGARSSCMLPQAHRRPPVRRGATPSRCSAAGRMQMPLAAASAGMGGHVRVGLEDNLWLEKGRLARLQRRAGDAHRARSSNASAGRVATPDEARAMLELKGRDKVGF